MTNILWLKRDLRVRDHKPLEKIIEHCQKHQQNFMAVYLFEPTLEHNYDFDVRHWQFVYDSLRELKKLMPVQLFYVDALTFFQYFDENFTLGDVFSHQETGVNVTFQRDIEITRYFSHKGIKWHEFQSNGVVRGLKNRKTWDAAWIKHMCQPTQATTLDLSLISNEHPIKDHFALPEELLKSVAINPYAKGGSDEAFKLLNDFLKEKVEHYFSSLSYPDRSRYHCSRLSPHISWGTISIRDIYQECKKRRPDITHKKSLDQFMARLKWHCHFVQKLEMEPSIEFENLNPSFNHIRTKKDKKLIKAWKEGRTGYPLVDAAMRCVNQTGYLNFRLRSMVVSFLTHHLWQPWQEGARHLARAFVDYEPGIHYCQLQMQAGTMGIHTIRIYNPVKQSKEKDKNAIFIKRWLPELEGLPNEFIHEPWKMTSMDRLMYPIDYPAPIIDYEKNATFARETLWEVKKSVQNKHSSQKILDKHTRRSKRKNDR